MNNTQSGTQYVTPEEWGNVLSQEYLAEYVRTGGSAIKVISGPPAQLHAARDCVLADAKAQEYFVAALDPAAPDEGGKKRDLHHRDRPGPAARTA